MSELAEPRAGAPAGGLLVLATAPDPADWLPCLQSTKAAHPDLAVIVLCPHADSAGRALALEHGADDCIALPADPLEVALRVNAVRKRNAPAPVQARRPVGKWFFETALRRLVGPGGETAGLSASEARLLEAFLDHPGQVLSRARLLQLSGLKAGDAQGRAVDLAVSRLRSRLGDNAAQPGLIRTVRSAGYVFDAAASRTGLPRLP